MPATQISTDVRSILAEYRRGLEQIYGGRLVRLVLFGSHARGDASAESDIDVLVVLRGPVHTGEEISRCSEFRAALCLKHNTPISCLYTSEEQFCNEQSPLMLNVRKEGVAI